MPDNTKLRYECVLDDLKIRIGNNEFSKEGKLPSEKEMSEYYQCSRPTLRKALQILKDENLISSSKGSGNYITGKSKNHKKVKKQNLFGFIMQNLGDNYIFGPLCNQIATGISEAGYSLLYGAYVKPDESDIWEQLKNICTRYIELEVNGVFFTPFETTKQNLEINKYILKTLSSAGIAVILLDSDIVPYPYNSEYDIVSLDHIHAGYILAKHLIDRGAKRIMFFNPPNAASTIKQRRIGFQSALFDAGINTSQAIFAEVDPDDTNEIEKILLEKAPDAIMCSNDGYAHKLVSTLENLGKKIPDDIMIAGFDNTSSYRKNRIKLTSIEQPLEAISNEAINQMFRRLEKPNAYKTITRIPGKLIIRKSTTMWDI